MVALNVHTYGPGDGPVVLALHGLTGHGSRWQSLATDYLPDLQIVAPDLLGHGHSPWRGPWDYDAHVAALDAVIDAHIAKSARPVVVVGHSYGGAIGIRLAAARPDDVAALVLLDPAQGLDPEFAAGVAEESLDHWDYADAEDARAAKRGEGWAEIPAADLEREITEHLIDRPRGRVGWRVSAPTAATAWSEMSKPWQLPPAGIPTDVVVADRVDPPFVGADFLHACATQRPETVVVHHVDCEHMVPLLVPEFTAELVHAAVAGTPTGSR